MELSEDGERHISRPYRSKRHRPCDFCRSRKVGCHTDISPPCNMCRKKGITCTYNLPATKKRQLEYRDDVSGGIQMDNRGSQDTPEIPSQLPDLDFLGSEPISPVASNFSRIESWGAALRNESTFNGHVSFLHSRATSVAESSYIGQMNAARRVTSDIVLEDPRDTLQELSYHDLHMRSQVSLSENDLISNDFLRRLNTPGGFNDPEHNFDLQTDNASTNNIGQMGTSPPKICSINDAPGVTGLYIGLGGELDPYLLRYFKYDENHQRQYFKVHFLKAADPKDPLETASSALSNGDGSSTASHSLSKLRRGEAGAGTPLGEIPVQFMLNSNELAEEEKEDTTFRSSVSSEDLRRELDQMVCPEDGLRLISLHLRFVYPRFPAVSRAVLPRPEVSWLAKIPTHLLAAIYASALPFTSHDPHLCVQNVYNKPPEHQIWRISLEEILREMHTPHLSVVQASLLYLQKPRRGSSAAADTPFKWSFMASLVALSTTLGLHLECKEWAIPRWEKRLRRRLWWLVYSEEKWRSLLLGMPSLISEDQWNVSDLDDEDFLLDQSISIAHVSMRDQEQQTLQPRCEHFRHLVSLVQIGDDVYRGFYTLRASRMLASNFNISLETAKPLRQRLKNWYSSLPPSLRMRKQTATGDISGLTTDSAASLHFAYLTLESLLFRALLRPLGGQKGTQPNQTGFSAGTSQVDKQSLNSGASTSLVSSDMLQAKEATYISALNCAGLLTSFAASLDSSDFGSFWYSWSRTGFSIVTNFIALLIAQAPTPEFRKEALSSADNWRKTLRAQSNSFDQMSLGLLRLEVMYWVGFDVLFAD